MSGKLLDIGQCAKASAFGGGVSNNVDDIGLRRALLRGNGYCIGQLVYVWGLDVGAVKSNIRPTEIVSQDSVARRASLSSWSCCWSRACGWRTRPARYAAKRGETQNFSHISLLCIFHFVQMWRISRQICSQFPRNRIFLNSFIAGSGSLMRNHLVGESGVTTRIV